MFRFTVEVSYTFFVLCCEQNVTVFKKKKFAQVFVGYQCFSAEKYHKNITFLSQVFAHFFRLADAFYLLLFIIVTGAVDGCIL